MRLICLLALWCAVSLAFVPPCAAGSFFSFTEAAAAAPQKTVEPALPADMQKALAQLDEFAKKRLDLVCDNIRPCKTKKDVIQSGAVYIARYLEVDVASLATEITVAEGFGAKYIGSVIYYEQIFECRGATKEEALAGEFDLVRKRHVTELFRYNKGRWID